MTDTQQQMIRDAMKSIAERKPGRTKLVYDKTKRTIVAVAAGTDAPRALNITADDAGRKSVEVAKKSSGQDVKHGRKYATSNT